VLDLFCFLPLFTLFLLVVFFFSYKKKNQEFLVNTQVKETIKNAFSRRYIFGCRRDLQTVVDTCHFYTFFLVFFLIEAGFGACHLVIREDYFYVFVFVGKV
jgi:hypothetical protein